MKISACLITKDEEKNIEQCLKSIEGIVDEIIVVDTGSRDNTINLANKYTNKIYFYQWNNDFSGARNFAIGKVKGDYILFLDADEYLTSFFDFKSFLLKEKNLKEAYLIKIRNFDKDKNNQIIDEFWANRLFKNDLSIRYFGKIHEQLTNVKTKKLIVGYIKGIIINHSGYSNSLLEKKAQRNLKILKSEFEVVSDKERLYSYLAETYNYLGDNDKAEFFSRKDIILGVKNNSYSSKSYRILIEILKDRNDKVELKLILEKAIANFPKIPDFKAEYALYLAETFEYKKAIALMNEAIIMSDKYEEVEPFVFKNEKINIAKSLIENWRNLLESKITITACVIVKNEEDNIKKWLDSTGNYADELIVVDTGSSDKTLEIVQSSSAKLYHYDWNDNFAEAKNYAISKATGDWIVFLDADEYFTEESVLNVKNIISKNHNDFDAIMSIIINLDRDNNYNEIARFQNVRIFKNNIGIKYAGKIHEKITKDGKMKILVENDSLQIIHTGYSSKIIVSKHKRNIKLLNEEIKFNKGKEEYYKYLSDSYYGLGDYKNAIKYAKMHLNSNIVSIGNESSIYINLINGMHFLRYSFEEIEKWVRRAINKFPNNPEFYAHYGNILMLNLDIKKAKEYFEKAISLYEKSSLNFETSFKSIVSETYMFLGEIALKEGLKGEANNLLKKALIENNKNVKALKLLFDEKRSYYDEEEIAFIKTIYRTLEEKKFILTAMKQNLFNISIYTFLKRDELFQEALKESDFKINENISLKSQEELTKLLDDLLYIFFTTANNDIKHLFQVKYIEFINSYYENTLKDNFFDLYLMLISKLLKNDEENVLNDFLSKIYAFSLINQYQCVNLLCDYQCWDKALNILIKIINSCSEVSSSVLCLYAKCLFYNNNMIAAKSYFEKLLEDDCYSNEAKSYLHWIEEEL